ncbi:hypothetical protein [Persicirhabdus sediminis]|uniref:Uncharacterized protein n=1 Tax=Persicirhabdus sediminis TaxID=454144 RepID=A0A8J7MFW9_9BACT|nr:hypothetical protein [Persicirhabdus sediminis]MBK1792080.1 hypothetical protein [Persicirhabdus sediminis]
MSNFDFGTQVWFKHANPEGFLEHLMKMLQICEDFYIKKAGYIIQYDQFYVDRFSRGGPTGRISFSKLADFDFSNLRSLEVSFMIPTPETNPDYLTVGFAYRAIDNRQEHPVLDRGLWLMTTGIVVSPYHIDLRVPKYQSQQDAIDMYNLIKQIHVEVGFDLTTASNQADYANYGEKDDPIWSYDGVMRLDKYGPCHLISPFEENRQIHRSESDHYGCKDGLYFGWSLRTEGPVEITYRG